MQSELRGEFVATLAQPENYAKNVGQVVAVSTEQLRYVRRRELAMTPFEVEVHELSGCLSVDYWSDWALHRIALGSIALALAALTGLGLFFYADRINSSIPVGAILFLAYIGYRNFAGGKRHVLTFDFGDRPYKWKSKPGEFQTWAGAVEAILDFARRKGLYQNPVNLR